MFHGTINSRDPPVRGVVSTHVSLTVILRYEGVRLPQQLFPQQQIQQQQIPRQQIQQPQTQQPQLQQPQIQQPQIQQQQIPQTQMIRLPPPHTLQREAGGDNPSRMHSIRALTRSETGPARNEEKSGIAAHALGLLRQGSRGYPECGEY
ncbi:MAG: hypothetical protein M1824_000790 [Vezdaea acicularis]|nr:MAG: hypothetical protein M1824_000790 [Vezdaea acicularis]